MKPENLLIGCFGEIKLSDFGWAFFYDPNETDYKLAGTLDYLCPEMVSNTRYDKKIDNWCLGKQNFIFNQIKLYFVFILLIPRSIMLRVISGRSTVLILFNGRNSTKNSKYRFHLYKSCQSCS